MKVNEYISVQNKGGNVAEIDIYGDIVSSKVWDECVTPKEVKEALKDCGPVNRLELHINSYGGSTSAGNGIISIIDDFKKRTGCKVEAYIEGMCASMASGVAMAADKIYMSENALLLIHKPIVSEFTGNANDMLAAIEYLNKCEDGLVKNYMRHWNRSEDELREALAQESIYTADEAFELGLCDEVIGGVNIAASAKGIRIGDQVFENKVADMIKNKYPNIILAKEEKNLTYDEKLGQYGITQDVFDSLGLESEKVLELANRVVDATKSEPETPFISKDTAASELGKEDITAEEVLNYAKAGMHPVDTTEMSKKAQAFDKVLADAKSAALTNAMQAMGDTYNEGRMKKYLDVLDYDEIVAQSDAWKEQAKKTLNAGKRVSARSDFNPLHNEEEDLDKYKI